MTPNLRESEQKLLRWAIEIAIGSEKELIDCHSDPNTGKCFDAEVKRRCNQNIKRLRKLWKKLHAATRAEK